MLNFPFIEAFTSYFKARNRQEGKPGLESDLAGTVELSSHFSTGGKLIMRHYMLTIVDI